MSPDSLYSVGILGVLLVVISFKRVSAGVLELLLTFTRSGATVVLLGSILLLFLKKLPYTALALTLLSLVLLKDIWTAWPRSDARRLHLEIGRDQARFDPMNSIDLQFGNGTATHDAPSMLAPPTIGKMLVFPPSAETLHEMNGS